MAVEFRIHFISGLVVLGTFLAGALAGAGLMRSREQRQRVIALSPLVRQLALPPAQQEQVDRIVASHRAEIEAVMHESFPRVRAIEERMNEQIREVLTPEQRKRFDELRAAMPSPGIGMQVQSRSLQGRQFLGGPPLEALEACKGRAAGDVCTMTLPAPVISARCVGADGGLVCGPAPP
jgi:hypothetical protein